MIHNAWTVAVGDQRAMADTAAVLAGIDAKLAQTYAKRANVSADEASDMMDAETWLNAEQAIEFGFADATIEGASDTKAAFDLSLFKNVPRALKQRRSSQSKKAEIQVEKSVEPDFSALSVALSSLQFAIAA